MVKTLKHYWVHTPNYTYTEPIFEDGSGPSYNICDVVCADGYNKKDACRNAAKKLAKIKDGHWQQCRSDGVNPYQGLKAELATCKHGVTCCDCEKNEDDYCEECYKEEEIPGMKEWKEASTCTA